MLEGLARGEESGGGGDCWPPDTGLVLCMRGVDASKTAVLCFFTTTHRHVVESSRVGVSYKMMSFFPFFSIWGLAAHEGGHGSCGFLRVCGLFVVGGKRVTEGVRLFCFTLTLA